MKMLEVKSITEMKKSLDELNSRYELAEDIISKRDDRLIQIKQSEEQTEKRMKENTAFQRCWEHHQVQHTHSGSIRRKGNKYVERNNG